MYNGQTHTERANARWIVDVLPAAAANPDPISETGSLGLPWEPTVQLTVPKVAPDKMLRIRLRAGGHGASSGDTVTYQWFYKP